MMIKRLARASEEMNKEDEKHRNKELIIPREHKKGKCVFALVMEMMIMMILKASS